MAYASGMPLNPQLNFSPPLRTSTDGGTPKHAPAPPPAQSEPRDRVTLSGGSDPGTGASEALRKMARAVVALAVPAGEFGF